MLTHPQTSGNFKNQREETCNDVSSLKIQSVYHLHYTFSNLSLLFISNLLNSIIVLGIILRLHTPTEMSNVPDALTAF